VEDPIQLIRQSRRMRSNIRFAGQRFLNPPNNMEHCQQTAALFIWLSRYFVITISIPAIDFVLNHDLFETETGDLLYPVKHAGINETLWAQIEANVLKKFPLMNGYTDETAQLDPKEKWLFSFCDALEGYITSLEEAAMGNKIGRPESCIMVYEKALSEMTSSSSAYDAIGMTVCNKARNLVERIEESIC